MRLRGVLLLCSLLGLMACNGSGAVETESDADATTDSRAFEPYKDLPAHFPPPVGAPADNPLTAAKVELGRHLFYDQRLSGNSSQSCSSCHQQAKAFTDGKTTSVGATGETHPRNSQTLGNAVYQSTLTWANPVINQLEAQHLTPIVATHPVELGLNDANRETVLTRFASDAKYQQLFAAAFPDEATPVTLGNIVKAIASFSRILLSYRSPFDQFEAGNVNAISDSAKRGLALFNSERLQCDHCHGGFNFSDSTRTALNDGNHSSPFHNTGLYNLINLDDGSRNNYPAANQGLFLFTGQSRDKGKMRAPSLRNVELTAPYNHDGSVATLSDIIDNYARGGRQVTTPVEHFGDGKDNENKDALVHGFTLSAEEKTDLINFLHSLTDREFTTDPALADPFS